ncbi:MAG: AMP-binding protein [Bdellovibrionaceae bacterium]|nr:AMP-binding protein [Bdellovibrionales bacterium]MCB9084937.1 AMP-binding protein [Pseudobdellovibrionaceae bacterium]
MSLGPIDWQGNGAQLFLNPRLSKNETDLLEQSFFACDQAHQAIGVMSSGTTESQEKKIILLSRSAFLASAEAVNQHLQVKASDVWYHCLPDFHVGGLSIWARAFLSGSSVVRHQGGWNPQVFTNQVREGKATWTSLVPTQVFDLVQSQLRAPESLRGVLVGGGSLSKDLYLRGRELGWPLLPTYGMTECCSQVATASMSSLEHLDYPALRILPHVETRIDEAGCLEISSPSLLQGYLFFSPGGFRFQNPLCDGWFHSQDRVDLSVPGTLRPLGRTDDLVKVMGELVDLNRLQSLVESQLSSDLNPGQIAVLAIPDSRQENKIILVTENSRLATNESASLLERINASLLPYERISEIKTVAEIPKTPLGKIRRSELLKLILLRPN